MEINSDKIREIRKNLNLNQKDFAKLLGRSQNTISQWENGLRSPDFASLEMIASRLNLPLEDICLESSNCSTSYRPGSQNTLNSNHIYDANTGRIYNKTELKSLLAESFDDTVVKKIGASDIEAFIDETIFVFAINKLYAGNFSTDTVKLFLNFLPQKLLNETSQTVHDLISNHISLFEKKFIKLFSVDVNSYIISLLDND